MFFTTDDLRNDEIYLKLDKIKDANPELQIVPAYFFKICLTKNNQEIGTCDIRIGHNNRLYYGGNIGYAIDEAFRGHHYAAKACLLLFTLAKKHNMEYLYITCDPDNYASSKTCKFLGGSLEAIVDLPKDNDMYLAGARKKCIYYFNLLSK